MKRGGVALVVAVLLAVAAAASVFLYVNSVKQRAETGGGTVAVVVSKEDIPANIDLDPLIADGVFEMRSVLRDDLVQGSLTDLYQLEGQRTAYPILAGEQIAAARLQGALQAAGGALGIPAGEQAVALTLEPQRVVGTALQQGDNVTVYGTFAMTGERPERSSVQTRTLVPETQVLAIALPESSTAGSSGSATVTLALTPEEAQVIIFAQERGTIWLSLLPPNQAGVAQPPTSFEDFR
jgi:pilus assembly protein CpaB